MSKIIRFSVLHKKTAILKKYLTNFNKCAIIYDRIRLLCNWGGILSEKEASCFDKFTDEELVKLSQDGDNLALDVLARRFLSRKPKMHNAGYLDVDDLLQEGMISFLSAVRTYKSEKGIPFSAYATVCMNNGVVSAVRKTKNDFQIDRDIDPVTVGVELKNPLDTIVDSENLSSVLSLCESVLSDVEKSVVYSQMSGLSYTETAEKLGLTPKAVDNALQRARKKLKNVFA